MQFPTFSLLSYAFTIINDNDNEVNVNWRSTHVPVCTEQRDTSLCADVFVAFSPGSLLLIGLCQACVAMLHLYILCVLKT